MKILVVTNLYPPHGCSGYEERCFHTVACLRTRGHEVHVLTSDHQMEGHDASGDEQVTRQLKMHGAYGHPTPPIKQLYELEKANQTTLRRQLQELQPDVLHIWNMSGISKSLLLTLEAGPTPVVYDISNYWIIKDLKSDAWLSWWNKSGSLGCTIKSFTSLGASRKVINSQVPTDSANTIKFQHSYFCSEFLRDVTAKQGFPVQHAEVIYSGVVTDLFQKKSNYGPPRKFLWVGRLVKAKDPLTAIKGFLRARGSDLNTLELDIYGHGDPEYTKLIEAEIKRANAANFIKIKTALHDEMRELYSQYDAYIFSSNWGEPFALTPLEAMAAGLPVLMCPDGGDAELIEDGLNAMKFSAGSPSSLAGAIVRLLQLKDHGQNFSRNALKIVNERYTVEAMTNKIEKVLRRAAR